MSRSTLASAKSNIAHLKTKINKKILTYTTLPDFRKSVAFVEGFQASPAEQHVVEYECGEWVECKCRGKMEVLL
jgi:hypothetical protein